MHHPAGLSCDNSGARPSDNCSPKSCPARAKNDGQDCGLDVEPLDQGSRLDIAWVEPQTRMAIARRSILCAHRQRSSTQGLGASPRSCSSVG